MSNLSHILQLTGELLLYVTNIDDLGHVQVSQTPSIGSLRQDAWLRYSSWFATPIYHRFPS